MSNDSVNESNRNEKKIVVAGDMVIDWLEWQIDHGDSHSDRGGLPNWRLYTGTRMVAREGGALLFARMVRAATGAAVVPHQLDEKIENIPPDEMIHSLVSLESFPRSSGSKSKGDNV